LMHPKHFFSCVREVWSLAFPFDVFWVPISLSDIAHCVHFSLEPLAY
jgi:hypothetical protein